MLYLLDANVLITASNSYYPINQVPEFWSWLQHQAASGHVKIPLEVMEEVLMGRRDDPLIDWISQDDNADALLLEEAPPARNFIGQCIGNISRRECSKGENACPTRRNTMPWRPKEPVVF